VKELRRKRLKEIEMWHIFRDIFAYFMFFWILCVVSYSNTNRDSFQFIKNIKISFFSNNFERSFTGVSFHMLIKQNKRNY
jgi:predicted MPP superfamily phosphohydrolase